MPGSTKTPGANCSVDDFAIGEVLPGPEVDDGNDSCQILTQAYDLDDNPGSDEMSVRSIFGRALNPADFAACGPRFSGPCAAPRS
jgi:hypothetical protein